MGSKEKASGGAKNRFDTERENEIEDIDMAWNRFNAVNYNCHWCFDHRS